jgi:hypothetical protein
MAATCSHELTTLNGMKHPEMFGWERKHARFRGAGTCTLRHPALLGFHDAQKAIA